MTSMRMSGSATPVGGDLGALDDTVIRFAHLADGRRGVFEGSRIGVVVTDLERNVRYANPAALRMFGLQSIDGVKLESMFPDETAREILRRQLDDRRHGLIGNYSVEGRRANNKHVSLEVTGLPIPDQHGVIVGALGLFRDVGQQQLANRIHDLNRRVNEAEPLLTGLAEALKTAFDFDRMSVSRFSRDKTHVNAFFTYGHDGSVAQKRWYWLNVAQSKWLMDEGAKIVPDIVKLMDEDLWKPLKDDAAVQDLLRAGIKSSLRRDVRRGGDVLGSVTLMSPTLDGFTEEQRRAFEELPIDATVLQALSHEEKLSMMERLDLLKALNGCATVRDACETLAHKLVRNFGWHHVSILRVDRTAGSVNLLAQDWVEQNWIRLDDDYAQPIGVGILGRVVKTGATQNVADVLKDPDYVRGVASAEVRSELCVPIFGDDEKDVRWIINVEDTRESAFAADECDALEEVAREVGGLMHRISELYILTQCFEHAADPVFVTDAELRIRRANGAAARLLGFKHASEITGDLDSLFEDPLVRSRLIECAPGDLGEFVMRRAGDRGKGLSDGAVGTVPVFVSRQDFPAGLTGSIFIAHDTLAIRRTVELELLEKAAYEVAVETSSPLALAICELEGLFRAHAPGELRQNAATSAVSSDERRRVDTVLRLLGRVRHGYSKLAMFNPKARPKPSELSDLSLRAEIEAIAAGLAEVDRVRVMVEGEGALPCVRGDHFQIGTIFETLLSELLRYAPETQPVEAVLAAKGGTVEVRLRGFLAPAGDGEAAAREWSRTRAEFAIAKPLIDEFMLAHRGSFGATVAPNGRTEFLLRFPSAGA